MRIIMGVDPGSQYCGFGLMQFEPGKDLKYLEHGVINVPKSLSFGEKLNFIHHSLNQKIKDWSPSDLVVENIFLGKNVQSAFRLGHVRGVCLQLSAQYKMFSHEYAPKTVKKAVTGQGGATKEHVAMVVGNLFGLPPFNNLDATDALALCVCHARKWESEQLINQQLKGASL